MSSDNKDALLTKILGTVRAASSLAAQDIDFCRHLDASVGELLDETSQYIVSLLNEVILSTSKANNDLEVGKDNLEAAWKDLSNIIDNLFEKSDHSLDVLQKLLSSSSSQLDTNMQYLNVDSQRDGKLSQRIVKPQLQFKIPVDNSECHPFKPLLKVKPHALKPLEEVSSLTVETECVPAHYPHPYEYEIDNQPYDDSVLTIKEPIEPSNWDENEPIWVDNITALNDMLNGLKNVKEIAVDLEHHDYRSYYGLVCLMQISTRESDWLVDTIALRQDLQVLNEIFTDPSILKVFHGAFMDIIWLQRDLGLYVVSLFDTYHASRALGFPKHSLAYLLETFANFKTSKKYQLADWRIRPLSKPMKTYARADTHFLLNIYDKLRNSLIKEDKLSGVLHASRNVAKRRFEYTSFRPKVLSPTVFSPIEKDDPWRTLMSQYNVPDIKEPLMRKLYKWRDMVARKDDESVRYVMPNQLLVSLVTLAPSDPSGLLTVKSYIPDHVRANARVLCNIINKTMEEIKSGSHEGQSIENVTTTYVSAQDPEMSVSLIKTMDRHFKFLLDEVQSHAVEPSSVCEDSLLFKGFLFDKPKAVAYNSVGKRLVNDRELLDRKSDLSQKFSKVFKAAGIAIGSHIEKLSSNSELPADTTSNVESPSKEESKNNSDDLKEDKHEIIVLKRKRDYGSNTKSTSKQPKKEHVDYNNVNSILDNTSQQDKPNSGRHVDKRKFHSDLQGSIGAAAIKKPRSKGKTVSYKK
ncbi:exosome nuclease subunit RRP6 Ecym_3030 [Eremothecium cymbalariae DBVPG|uniref:HRDC domain-containing protein n=1 Tax=Eremothecium cymbalariae (strain CBS 270.75 / DBVPG 7215 / KCTC 17166 / NRRL Y-17582) TaxID=931890 RepID=G8JQX6_ERECY|nr:Hypothetical protein Ecym_3030 [Eremothecium cymbalariae DBVPG\